MFSNYLKIACRNLLRNKLYSVITILGLAIGLCGFILISLYVRYEYSFDKFHYNYENLYRLSTKYDFNGEYKNVAMSPPAFAPLMQNEFPEIKKSVRIHPFQQTSIKYENNIFNESIHFSEQSLFNVFSFNLVQGNSQDILVGKRTAVISEKTARKIFGNENAVGKVVNFGNLFDLVIEGVFADIPDNSHLQLNFIVSLATLEDEQLYGSEALKSTRSCNYYTYFLVDENSSIELLQSKFDKFNEKYQTEESRKKIVPYLEKFGDIYLYSDTIYGTGIEGNIQYLYIFIAVAFFIVILASINFINLTSSNALYRIKEVGIRKVIGSGKRELLLQFLGESVFTVLLGFLISIVFVELLEPVFADVIGKSIRLNFPEDIVFISIHLLISVVMGVISGVYPALYMSSFNIAEILKGVSIKSTTAVVVRKSTVIFQFVISVILITGTIIIFKQINYIQNKDLGYSKENVVYFSLNTESIKNNTESLKNELLKNSNIIAATVSNRIMGGIKGEWHLHDEEQKRYGCTVLFVDEDYSDVFGISINSGRWFDENITTDKTNSFLITRSTSKIYGWNNPLEKKINLAGFKYGNIIGVLDDFNFQSLHEVQKPIVLTQFKSNSNKQYMLVKITGNNINETIGEIEEAFSRVEPNQKIEIKFLDQFLSSLYLKEVRTAKLLTGFSLLAIVLGCLGLFGLSLFSANKRTKEIGIKKVLGATVVSLVYNSCWGFIKLVIIASIIAVPITSYVMAKWLSNFAYRTNIGYEPFLLGIFISVAISAITVSYHAVKSAIANPVNSLRSE